MSGTAGSDADERATTGRTVRATAVLGSVLFVAGFAVVFVSYGALFGAAGSLLVAHQETLTRVLGSITILLGLLFAGVFGRIPWLNSTFRLNHRPRVGLVGAPLLGALFGIGWTPCIGPTLAAVLALSSTTGGAGRGAALSLAYSVGLGLPFVLAAAGLQRALVAYRFAQRHARLVMRAGGLLLIVLGVLQVTGLWSALIIRLQVVIANWQVLL